MKNNVVTQIEILNASENNLKNISLTVPHQKIIAVTGVSGSGKSSLAFNVIAQTGQKRYLETFSSFTKAYLGKTSNPEVDEVNGITPVISIAQKTATTNSRSTVGTLLDAFDYFKHLYSRLANSKTKLTRTNFSFNTKEGACEQCGGLGLEEYISVDKLIANPQLTLREGALVPTLPNGYIVYSQVTVDVLNTVCNAHGFSVDIPWKELTPEQQNIILNGSEKLKVPYGKHSLESRMKWTGIKAKPREEGFYKGMLPTMSDILKRDRNKNILRFVSSKTCQNCEGKRYNNSVLNVELNGLKWKEFLTLSFKELLVIVQNISWQKEQETIALPFTNKILETLNTAIALGLGHLSFERSSESLAGGELQRIRILNQVTTELSDVTYVFDEPSIGLHPAQNKALINVFKQLKKNGNTVLVVEHDLETIVNADWIIDIGPKAGENGGEVIFNGPMHAFLAQEIRETQSETLRALKEFENNVPQPIINPSFIDLIGCNQHNLKNCNARFLKEGVNAIVGVSGAGKSTLINSILVNAIKNPEERSYFKEIKHHQDISRVIAVNQKPIGRTPRSNPATYIGLSDKIRDVFSKTEQAKKAQLKKSHFSFNTKGGRCETCEGAGQIEVGMHFLSNVSAICETCNGKRFKKEVLAIKYNNLSIAEVYNLSVKQAIAIFKAEKTILHFLILLQEVGLEYLKLGQPSTTLSGGEAQRIKLVSELHKQSKANTLYVLDEPSVGLHHSDLKKLIKLLKRLADNSNTIVCITHNTHLINSSDFVLELGPNGGDEGGEIIASGTVNEIKKSTKSKIKNYLQPVIISKIEDSKSGWKNTIKFKGVETHNLKKVSPIIFKNKLNVIAGVSGSGKTSFAVNTLYTEAQARYAESLSNHVRGKLKLGNQANFETVSGLTTAIKIDRKSPKTSDFSTVGTATGIYDSLRLLYSRIAEVNKQAFSASDFSFNQKSGACLACNGKGFELKVDEFKLVPNPNLSVEDGLFLNNKATQFYADPEGQFMTVFYKVAEENKIDLKQPWKSYNGAEKQLILYGSKEKQYTVVWKTKEKEQTITKAWLGFAQLVEEEYKRRILNKNIGVLLEVMSLVTCAECKGERLKNPQRSYLFEGLSIGQLAQKSVLELYDFFCEVKGKSAKETTVFKHIADYLKPVLQRIINLGVGHISLSRATHTLSGGEFQRINLSGNLANKLSGVTYVIDEPTVGLHQDNLQALFEVLEELKQNNNTLVVIEHNSALIKKADHLIEFGPKAGVFGGEIIHQGSIASIEKNENSVLRQYIKKKYRKKVKPNLMGTQFGVKNITKFGLQNLSAAFYSNTINALTGVSGAGKTTVIKELLNNSECSFGLTYFEEILAVKQEQMHSNRTQTVASVLGFLDEIKTQFSKTEHAKRLKLGKNAFSYLHKEGRCKTCKGSGVVEVALDFLQNVVQPCSACNGDRYQASSLEVKYKGKSVVDVLNCSVSEAKELFEEDKKVNARVELAEEVGLGYLNLNQPVTTLSSGEKQRLKLATSLLNKTTNTLFILDEPSAGLHPKDIEKVATLFHNLVAEGNTILFVEHNAQLIAEAQHITVI